MAKPGFAWDLGDIRVQEGTGHCLPCRYLLGRYTDTDDVGVSSPKGAKIHPFSAPRTSYNC